MRKITYILTISFVLNLLVYPVAVLAKEQKEPISSSQRKIDKKATDILQKKVEEFPLEPEEKGVPLPEPDVENEGYSTVPTKKEPPSIEKSQAEENKQSSTEESTRPTPAPKTQDNSEIAPRQEKLPKTQYEDLMWGGVWIRFFEELGLLLVHGGTTFANPGPLLSEVKAKKVKRIEMKYTITITGSADEMFANFTNLEEIVGLEHLDTRHVTSMKKMFWMCSTLPSLDVSNFITSSVTDMSNMFEGCLVLTSLDVSNFITSSVTDMNNMFAFCYKLDGLDVSNFNTSNVTNMEGMFYNCNSLANLDVSNFNTSNVTNMEGMFYKCNRLANLDVSNFNTSSATTMYLMFYECSSLANLDVSNFNTSNVTNMGAMFAACEGLTSLDLSNFNTSNVTNMEIMFAACEGLTSLDLSNFNTSNVTYMQAMFGMCEGLTSLDLSNFNMSNVSDMRKLFDKCNGLSSLRLGRQFKMNQTVALPDISATEEYTGKWQNIGTGTRENPNGAHIWTSEELMANYSGTTDADTYVWQPVAKVTTDSTVFLGEQRNKVLDYIVKVGD
ncbi:BspA family leucine-rich repeat surface protein, partial [Enterococcus faecalis]|uniref:BspA family leucine-rich repeat surface protein n=1 Tax=Enterococcus faecalis TaxID=1351 RepID=UPI003D0B1AB9